MATHLVGDLNVIGDIPYSSFDYFRQLHCTKDSVFLSPINFKYQLPHQRSWQGLRLSFALNTKVISEFGIKAFPMGKWKRLWIIGKSFGGYGVPIENPSELTHTWRK